MTINNSTSPSSASYGCHRRPRPRLAWRDRVLLPLILLLTVTYHARAQDSDGPGAATMLARGMAEDMYLVMPYVDASVDIGITGMVARVTVTQHYYNDTGQWLEGEYLFPLPENAAVDRLKLVIGERIIEGEIREKEQARREFAEARRAGKRAGLVEQSRPNLFSTEVTNIGPDEHVAVEISYLQQLDFEDGGYSLRYPMTLTPRYTPGLHARDDEATAVRPKSTHTAAAPAPNPAYRPPSADNINMTTLAVRLDAGMPLDRLHSRYHDMQMSETRDDGWWLQSDLVPSDRDFVLEWSAATGDQSRATVFTQRKGEDTYLLMMVMPPQRVTAPLPPRELVFVIDTSGSMLGDSMEQARRALIWGLDTLRPEDRFNLIQFNSQVERLFDRALPAAPANLERAHGYIDGLEAGGGTDMAPALELALTAAAQPGLLRQVVFVTDGSVGNERELFSQIESQLGGARLFTVGIGSAPNSYFMRKAAQFGRGTFTYIGSPEDVQAEMSSLFAKLEYPVMRDLSLDWPGVAESYPRVLPDLYLGQPVVISARYRGSFESLTLRDGSGSWTREISLGGSRDHQGVAALWARQRIGFLRDGLVLGEDPELVRELVTETALAHHLVSPYTSLIAVDKTPARSAAQKLNRQKIASNLPHGSSVMLPQGASGLPGYLLMLAFGLTLLTLAWRMRTPEFPTERAAGQSAAASRPSAVPA